jgi:glycosyltransferase involved in cell wall biosynthesis
MNAFEGMAAGKPIIATRIGALPEITHNGVKGFLAPEDMPQVAANRILTIFHDRQMASYVSLQDIASAENQFSWRKAAIETIGVYRKAISECTGGG